MKNFINKIGLLFIAVTFVSFFAKAGNYEQNGTIEKEFKVDKNTRIEFTNKSNDLQIKTWDKPLVRLECKYKLRASDKEDIDKTIEALQHLDVSQSPSLLSIKTSVFTNIHSIIVTGLVNKIVGTLSNGVTVNLKEYKIEFVLIMPDNHEFSLKQKYSDVSMPDYSGPIELDLYDVDMKAGHLPNANYLKTKYSNLSFKTLGNCEMDIYDSDIEIGTLGDINLKSKYSKIETNVVGSVIMDSYDDKLYFQVLKSIKGSSKYSDITLGDFTTGELDLYDCEIRGESCRKLRMEAKYSGIELKNVDVFEFYDSYDNTVDADFVGEFSTISKYSEYKFGRIAGFIDFNTYDDKLTVQRMDKDFYKINIEGKYTDVELAFEGRPKYFLDVELKYVDYSFPSDVLFSNLKPGDSKFEASGLTEGLRRSDAIKVRTDDAGIRKANIGEITLNQYDGSFVITY